MVQVMETMRLLLVLSYALPFHYSAAQIPGFLSMDCGGTEDFTDELGIVWTADNQVFGERAEISVANETRKQYMTLRHFPADTRKYCYTFDAESRRRYLVRATFLYGNFDNNNVYPEFDISLGATHWSTIVISDASTAEVRELIFLAAESTVSVCLSNATTGEPFISTLELRQFNGSIYFTEYENEFYLSVSARINFGAESEDPIRYPHDPFDRIWESDSLKKANYLVDVAVGTQRVSTQMPIYVNKDERPPEKVMQTAVVGTNGALSYRLNLDDFPGSGWAFTYFAEIEELDLKQSRKFRLILPGAPDLSKPVVDIQENAPGKYRLYEPGYYNISLPFVLSFKFMKTSESSLGPLLNAMEISKYLKKVDGSLDGALLTSVVSKYSNASWAREGGDPCLPVPWSWVQCDTETQPSIIMINLSKRNLSGNIPEEFVKLSGLVELWLDGNSLTGTIPDFSGCTNLRIIHIDNNQLTGKLPSSLASLPNLKELYVQNNMLSGPLPSGLQGKSLILNYTGNVGIDKESKGWTHNEVIIGVSIAVTCLLIMSSALFFYMQKVRTRQYQSSNKQRHSLHSQRLSSSFADTVSDTAHTFSLSEIEEATKNFEKKVGSGGFGVVYYGKLKDGKEIAVKLLTNNSFQGKREFANEVSLLSRIHHRNLVQFYGSCQEEDKSMLVYEYMHNGTLKEHLYGPLACRLGMSWIKRLEVAVDAAKGIEYLHSGCIPAVIHRDLKSSNILLDRHMQAKVSDFGLSKLAVEGASHVSSIVRGTVGYLDPEYYISQQLTDKSDMYSFGVILLELISGREAISNEVFGPNCRNIVQWAKWHIESGNILGIVDPLLGGKYDVQSMWKIAEKALMCVRLHGSMRPSISEVIIDIQDAVAIEKGAEVIIEGYSDEISSRTPMRPTSIDEPWAFDESIFQPDAR